EVEDLGLEHLFAGESQELTGESGRAIGGLQDRARLLALGTVGQAAEEHLTVAGDHVQQVVEVVGHAAGQTADRFDLLRLPKLLLELAALRDVTEDGEVTAGKEVGARRELQLPDAAVGAHDAQLALGAALP